MSTNRTLPTTPLSQIPSGTDVRNLRGSLNRIIDTVNTLIPFVRALSRGTRIPVVPPHNPPQSGLLPLQVYIEGGYVCVRQGHHLWWNSNTATISVNTLEKDVDDEWASAESVTVVYVRRVYNADGTANPVELMTANTDYASVMAGVTTTEARWILATLADGAVETQWWTGGDIYELRVA